MDNHEDFLGRTPEEEADFQKWYKEGGGKSDSDDSLSEEEKDEIIKRNLKNFQDYNITPLDKEMIMEDLNKIYKGLESIKDKLKNNPKYSNVPIIKPLFSEVDKTLKQNYMDSVRRETEKLKSQGFEDVQKLGSTFQDILKRYNGRKKSLEKLSEQEKIEALLPDPNITTSDLIYEVISFASSYLEEQNYKGALNQLEYLRRIDIQRYLDGDEIAKEVVEETILELEEKLE
tara:strand:+ start:124 stop:816 length:693 start_codon:yes stop_codon:yes gene_type:complete